MSPTFVVASAIATRDFQDVRHDRDRAVAGGSKDIFLDAFAAHRVESSTSAVRRGTAMAASWRRSTPWRSAVLIVMRSIQEIGDR